jgi:hypothetical protein
MRVFRIDAHVLTPAILIFSFTQFKYVIYSHFIPPQNQKMNCPARPDCPFTDIPPYSHNGDNENKYLRLIILITSSMGDLKVFISRYDFQDCSEICEKTTSE